MNTKEWDRDIEKGIEKERERNKISPPLSLIVFTEERSVGKCVRPLTTKKGEW